MHAGRSDTDSVCQCRHSIHAFVFVPVLLKFPLRCPYGPKIMAEIPKNWPANCFSISNCRHPCTLTLYIGIGTLGDGATKSLFNVSGLSEKLVIHCISTFNVDKDCISYSDDTPH